MVILKIINMLNLSAEFVDKLPNWYKPTESNHALLCWDIITMNSIFTIWNNSKAIQDFSSIRNLKKDFTWNYHYEKYYYLANNKAAVVITDLKNTIIWVSANFETMTGYKSDYAINKSPSFLQGTNTDITLLEKLSFDLKTTKKATATILNYKPNGETYLCKIEIEPLFNTSGEHTHYIAYEREIII